MNLHRQITQKYKLKYLQTSFPQTSFPYIIKLLHIYSVRFSQY